MKRVISERIVNGVVAGMLAGLVVALWFLVVDVVAGRPFHTPAALASALSGRDVTTPTFRLVAAYTVVHFAVFALLGVAMAGAIAALRVSPRLLLGVPFGIVAQELVFYAGLLLSGTNRVAVVPWPHVVAANVLSGFVLMAYLHRAARDQHPLGLAALKGHPLLAQGLVTGLGAALLFGASNVAAVQANIGLVAAYTVVHVAAFAVAGIVFVAIAEQVERTPALILIAVMAAIVLEAVVVSVMALGAQWVLGALGVWTVVAANVLAVCAMGWYVWATHPVLRRRLREPVQVRV